MLEMTWNCWRVIVVGVHDGCTLMTRSWHRSAVITVDDWPTSSAAGDVAGFSLKKSVRMRSTCAFHSRRRRSILSCISSQATLCRSLMSCALPPSVVAMLLLSTAACCWPTTAAAGDCDTTNRSAPVELLPGLAEHDRRPAWTSPLNANVDWSDDVDVGRNTTDVDGVENPLEAPDAGSTTNESICDYCRVTVAVFLRINTLHVLQFCRSTARMFSWRMDGQKFKLSTTHQPVHVTANNHLSNSSAHVRCIFFA